MRSPGAPMPVRRVVAAGTEQRATFLEPFFDLVYVFAVTQLSHHLIERLTIAGALQTLFLLPVVWWGWIYTTWMANRFDPKRVAAAVAIVAAVVVTSDAPSVLSLTLVTAILAAPAASETAGRLRPRR